LPEYLLLFHSLPLETERDSFSFCLIRVSCFSYQLSFFFVKIIGIYTVGYSDSQNDIPIFSDLRQYHSKPDFMQLSQNQKRF